MVRSQRTASVCVCVCVCGTYPVSWLANLETWQGCSGSPRRPQMPSARLRWPMPEGARVKDELMSEDEGVGV